MRIRRVCMAAMLGAASSAAIAILALPVRVEAGGFGARSATDEGRESAFDVLARIPIEKEHRGGYTRSLFPQWLDLDANGCNARADVLRRDSIRPVPPAPSCSSSGGAWLSPYDGTTTASASAVEIDHVVALKEAWDSGAWQWTPTRRAQYANDLTDNRTLRAVSSVSNQTKGDADPSNWLPVVADRCRFLGDWIAIKARWGLSADPSEWGRINNVLTSDCPSLEIAATPPLPSETLRGFVAASPVSTPSSPPSTNPMSTTSSVLDPAASVYYRNCAEAWAAGVAPLRRGEPGYRSGLDGNNDGVACEKRP